MYRPILFLASALSLSLPGFAVANKGTTEGDPNTVRCRSVRELGSRIPKRVCKTNEEWAREREAARQAMDDRNRASHCSDGC
jgi:hypothetical protein